MEEPMITTSDNPFNPRTHWDEWYAFDTRAGYNTLNYIARIYEGASSISISEQNIAYARALNDIVSLNPTLYKFVS